MIIEKYPGIKLVSLIIAYDNGFIHRDCSKEQWLLSLDSVLGATGVDTADLEILDRWCQTLTKKQSETLGAGEYNDIMELVSLSPKPELCNSLFNDIFEFQEEEE